jgi:hypothetical protein
MCSFLEPEDEELMRRRGHSFGGILASWIAVSLALASCGGGSSKLQDASPEDSPDAGNPFVCDPIHRTGCGAGEKCDIASTGTFGCVPDGSLGDFRACGAKDKPNDCVSGFTCSGTFSAANRCTQLCGQRESTPCLRDEPCETSHLTQDGRQYLTCTTHEACNPILDDCAEPNTHCTYIDAAARSFCMIAGTVPDGAICQVLSGGRQECLAGSACVNVGPGGMRKCVRMCNLSSGDPSCPAGVTCMPFATVGPQAVGTCPPT